MTRNKPQDKLNSLFALQTQMMKALDDKYAAAGIGIEDIKLDPEAQVDRAIITLVAMGNELSEVMNELPWKSWKSYPPAAKFLSNVDEDGRVQIDKVKEEAVDLLFFLMELYLVLGLRPEDVYEIYLDKMTRNLQRVQGDWALPSERGSVL